jgi:signal transduction histidine kinase
MRWGAKSAEQVLRSVLEHPVRFAYGALAIGVVVTLLSGIESPGDALLGLAQLTAFVAWLHLWERRRTKDQVKGDVLSIVLAFVGILLLASLAARHLIFSMVALPLVVQYFTSLPLPVAILSFLPMVYAAESAHHRAILEDPASFPWGMTVIRGLVVILIGIALRTLAQQMEEGTRLQASLASAERKGGVLEERQRLAREIHDTLAQGFAGILVHFERAEQIDSLAGSAAKPHLEMARSVAREGLEEARRMLAALRPEILEQRGLPDALNRVCEEWSRRTGIEARLSVTGSPAPMHPDIELTVLRGTQEALTNAARHSEARSAAVTLSYMDDVIVLDVQDDGRGFLPEAVAGTGYGLAGMRERIESLRGSISIESLPGEGTTISFSLPAIVATGSETSTNGRTA